MSKLRYFAIYILMPTIFMTFCVEGVVSSDRLSESGWQKCCIVMEDAPTINVPFVIFFDLKHVLSQLGTDRMANQLNISDLQLFCCNTLLEGWQTFDFKQLDYHEFHSILKQLFEKINIYKVYNAILKWAGKDEGRETYFVDELLQLVEFSLMDDDFLKTIAVSEKLIASRPYLLIQIDSILMNRKLLILGSQESSTSAVKYCPRTKQLNCCSPFP